MEPLGLRDRQRLRRHRTILFSAAKLFEDNGFAETTMEDIAALAEVSPPTIYNYFRSKSDILLGLLEVDKEMMEEALDAIVNGPVVDGLVTILAFVRADHEGGYDVTQKAVWRMIASASYEGDADYLDAQSVVPQKLRNLINRLQADGHIRASADAEALTRLIISVMRQSFRTYLTTPGATTEDLRLDAEAQLRQVWDGIAP